MKINYIVVPMLAVALLAGCKQKEQEAAVDVVVPVEEERIAEEPQEDKPVELVPVIRDVKHTNPAATKAAAAPAKKKEKGETLYVETDGAQGRVWGHVTMYGDRGTGTIHDWDENTWAVNVTRHGDELFATDQNSRLYVFKLKNNKANQ